MKLLWIDHVQLAMPPDREEDARTFYRDLLGLTELPKPAPLAARGGAWFGSATVQIHLGVEADFRPATKAHPAIRVQAIELLAEQLRRSGYEVSYDTNIPEVRRFYVSDPFGNRLEFLEPFPPAHAPSVPS